MATKTIVKSSEKKARKTRRTKPAEDSRYWNATVYYDEPLDFRTIRTVMRAYEDCMESDKY